MKSVQLLLDYMKQHNLDAFFLAKKHNIRYISGYTGSDSYIVITPNRFYFLTDPRYTEQVSIECPEYQIVLWKNYGSIGECVAQIAKYEKISSLAFEADTLNYLFYSQLEKNVKAELVPTTDVVERFRSVKTPQEIEYLRAACDISCRAFEHILKDIRVGVTEKELAAKLSAYMVMEGADTQPYGNILISGARTSLLHGIPSSKAVEYGDFVLMDFGCQFNGYLSDMTRTVVVGRANAKQREVYELEKQMLEDSLAKMKAGVPLKEVYDASIQAVKDTEYYQYIYSGIGHGIGMFVHEIPFMGPNSTELLEENSVRTIEPGIYIPNWGGVRIEDQILITKDGYENMISTTHELIEL